MSDCVKELREYMSFFSISNSYQEESPYRQCVLISGESNTQMVTLSDELSQKNEELLKHQEEIAQLLSQIVELQHRVKEVS